MNASLPVVSPILLVTWNWALDGWIIVAGILCAVSAALLGNFLVLRRLSLLGDAISHAILPGLAAAFLLTGSRSSLPMFIGAAVVGILTAVITEWVRREGKVDDGASMGVIFTSLFALGLIMIVQAADHVDLDASCVLHGAIELTPLDRIAVGPYEVPRVVVSLSIVLLLNVIFIVSCYKELKISAFDPALSNAVGIPSSVMHYLLTTMVAITAVASFEAVGSILVVAMLVVPPATAYLCTDRLSGMIWLSVCFAILSAVVGHWSAVVVPSWFGFRSTTTAGLMAVAAGLFFAGGVFFAPRHGVIPRWWRHRAFAWQVVTEDVLASLFRLEERGEPARVDVATLGQFGVVSPARVLHWLVLQGKLQRDDAGFCLTEAGRQKASRIVRSHRLWESYLVQEAGLPSDRIHERAEQLEHFTDREMRAKLDEHTADSELDPHGTPIPPES